QRRTDPGGVQGAPVGDRRVGAGELERGDRHVALADRGDRSLAWRPLVPVPAVVVGDLLHVAAIGVAVPAPVVLVLLPVVVQPLPGGDRAGRLLRQVNAG